MTKVTRGRSRRSNVAQMYLAQVADRALEVLDFVRIVRRVAGFAVLLVEDLKSITGGSVAIICVSTQSYALQRRHSA